MDPIDFYTVESKEQNAFTPYVKTVRLFGGTKKNPKWLPTRRYVFPEGGKRTGIPKVPEATDEFRYSGTPTEEQSHVLGILRRRRDEYAYGCWLIWMGTWKGKSHVIMSLAAELGTKTLVLCHNVKTLTEMVDKFKEHCSYSPWRYDGTKKQLKDVTISTHKSFMLSPETFRGFGLIIVDECDVNFSPAFVNALCEVSPSYVYGLTGTTYRKNLNQEDMEKVYGKVVSFTEKPVYAFKPKVTMLRYKSPKYEYETFSELKTLMTADEERLAVMLATIEKLRATRRCVLVLTERVEEAQRIATGLKKAILITWETKTEDDDRQLEKVYQWKWHVIVGTVGKVARWVDIPPIDTVCMFASLMFQWTVVQAVGRCMRKFEWKDDVLIVDWCDSAIWKQGYERKNAYAKEYWLTDNDYEKYACKDYITWWSI